MNSAVIERNGTRLELHNCDCLPFMRGLPDKAFDLAIVDPPYGIGEDGGAYRGRNGSYARVLDKKGWDTAPPDLEYFSELERVSCGQIIWGANHFAGAIKPSAGWVYWDKLMGGDFSDGELAYTSFDRALRKFTLCNKEHGKIHPTQKPVALYSWLLANYAKPGQTILDTHLGSGSIAIACLNHGHSLTACELDPDYFKAAVARIEREASQAVLPIPTNKPTREPEALLL